MATKKIKRFQEGGMSDKDRGLQASKDDKVGFFERLRMGNIDEEGSEAYRRFGAGRGKAERTPVETMTATPASRPTTAASEMDAMEEANAREPISVPAGPKAEQPKSGGGKSRVNEQASKPSKASPKMQEQTYRRTSGDTGEREQSYRRTSGDTGARDPAYSRKSGATADEIANYEPPAKRSNYSNEGRGKTAPKSLVEQIPKDKSTVVGGERVSGSELGRNVANTMSALGPGKLAGIGAIGMEMRGAKGAQEAFNKATTARRTAEMRSKADATKFTSKPKATQKNTTKKTKKFDDEESNVEFKRGGSVSGASKRADGIATKGKTRCKMR